MKSYPAYKHSGVPWLGEIPEHWETKRAKYLFDLLGRPVEPHHEVITCFRDGTVTLRKNRRLTGFTESLTEVGYQGVKKGDLVIHQMDAFAGAVGISDSDGKTTPVCSVCSSKVELSKPYFAYIIRRMASSNFIFSLAKGIRQRSTDFRFATFARCTLPVPPLSEQATIAAYLDKKCGEIDEMVRRRQAIIERLRELKQALIAKAVTKGLHPEVPMKDSGIPWLGEIPEHWEMRPIKRIFSEVDKKKGDLSYPLLSFSKEKGLVISSENRKGVPDDLSNYKILKKGQLLENRMQAWNGMFICADKDGCVSPDYSVFETINTGTASVKFYEYVFRNHIWVKQFANASKGIGTGFNRLYTPQFGAIKTVYPPYKEQSAIASYLDKKCAAIDELISRHGQIVEKLRELKASTIAHVVTGKIDIRERA